MCVCTQREEKLSVVCCLWWGVLLSFLFFSPTSFPLVVDSLSPEKVADGVLSSRWLPKGHPRLVSLPRWKNSFYWTFSFCVLSLLLFLNFPHISGICVRVIHLFQKHFFFKISGAVYSLFQYGKMNFHKVMMDIYPSDCSLKSIWMDYVSNDTK
jgi:hypothetical protein